METTRTCKLSGCDRPLKSLGWCEMHYLRWRRNGTTDLLPRGSTIVDDKRVPLREIPCSLDECDRPQSYRMLGGVCRLHGLRFKKRGDVHFRWTGRESRSWTGDDGSYSASHQRIRKELGSARHRTCVDCGKPARHWSYNHRDPNEKWGTIGNDTRFYPYSTRSKYYEPRCVSCHKLLDLGRKRDVA